MAGDEVPPGTDVTHWKMLPVDEVTLLISDDGRLYIRMRYEPGHRLIAKLPTWFLEVDDDEPGPTVQ
jgi:hypothetical protein